MIRIPAVTERPVSLNEAGRGCANAVADRPFGGDRVCWPARRPDQPSSGENDSPWWCGFREIDARGAPAGSLRPFLSRWCSSVSHTPIVAEGDDARRYS
jgi:hypothetical protein